MSNEPLFPEVTVQLINQDGNAFHIIGRTRQALRRHGANDTQIEEYTKQATEGDYDNVLQTTMRWVNVE